MTKTFKNIAAQGDMILRRIDCLPEGLNKESPLNGEYILTHSETGHNHAIKEREDVQVYQSNDNFLAYLVVGMENALLEHHRSYKQHETIVVPPGIYEVRRQREEDVFGDIRRALD